MRAPGKRERRDGRSPVVLSGLSTPHPLGAPGSGWKCREAYKPISLSSTTLAHCARFLAHTAAANAMPGTRCKAHPGGSPEATRRAFNKRFLLDLAEDWQQHGREVFKRVRRRRPASHLNGAPTLLPTQSTL